MLRYEYQKADVKKKLEIPSSGKSLETQVLIRLDSYLFHLQLLCCQV